MIPVVGQIYRDVKGMEWMLSDALKDKLRLRRVGTRIFKIITQKEFKEEYERVEK